MRKMRGSTKFLTWTILIIGAGIAFIPLYWLIRSSFMSLGELYIFPPLFWSRDTHWANYLQAMTVLDFPTFFKNTMTILIPVLIGTLLIGSMCAYAFARLKFPLRGFWFALVLSNLMLPYAVVMLPRFILWSRLGAVNTFYPLIVPAWFGTGIGGAFMIFLLRQFFLTIPKDFEDAAIIDGAGYFMIYWRIMLPLVKPALIVVSLFTFMFVWNDFLGPLIYLNEIKKYTLALGLLQFQGTYNADWHLLMAASTVIVVPPIIVFLVGQKYFIEGVTLTGLKV